jgi:methionine sulfoxide reductase catalytic subunit
MKNSTRKGRAILPSEITPEHLYFSRRRFMKLAGLLGAGTVLAACGVPATGEAPNTPTPAPSPSATRAAGVVPTLNVPHPESGTAAEPPVSPVVKESALSDVLTSEEAVNGFNNFYEFTTNKEAVAGLAEDFKTSPWDVEVGGLVRNPKTYAVEDILKRFDQEERIYRMRCVEGWSMVIPWLGFPLAQLLAEVEPLSEAKYVRFETLYDPEQMRGQLNTRYPWPYQEGLRLDEALHDLTVLSTGLYGKSLLPQTGAPIRLVVPWKYGFKSIKSIVKIELVAEEPATLWSTIAPSEYGFYANVNPNVPHPRWSQATERRIGESGRIPTLLHNGYADEVAYLYEGMDLTKYF